MNQLDRIEELLQDHIKETHDYRVEVMQSLSKLEVYSKEHNKRIDKTEKDVEGLKKWKWSSVAALGAGLSAWLQKLFS